MPRLNELQRRVVAEAMAAAFGLGRQDGDHGRAGGRGGVEAVGAVAIYGGP